MVVLNSAFHMPVGLYQTMYGSFGVLQALSTFFLSVSFSHIDHDLLTKLLFPQGCDSGLYRISRFAEHPRPCTEQRFACSNVILR